MASVGTTHISLAKQNTSTNMIYMYVLSCTSCVSANLILAIRNHVETSSMKTTSCDFRKIFFGSVLIFSRRFSSPFTPCLLTAHGKNNWEFLGPVSSAGLQRQSEPKCPQTTTRKRTPIIFGTLLNCAGFLHLYYSRCRALAVFAK